MNKHTSSVSLIDGHIEDRTDAEIIKALKICIAFLSGGDAMCNNCPLLDCDNCSSEIRKQTLDLINRQQKKIDIMQSYLNENGHTLGVLSYARRNGLIEDVDELLSE